MAYCNNCGAENLADASFCSECGATITGPPVTGQAPTRLSIAHRRGHMDKKIVAVLVVVVVLVAAVVLFLARGSPTGGSSPGGGASAQDCLENEVVYMNGQEWDKYVDCTVVHFMSKQDQKDAASYLESSASEFRATISNIEEVTEYELGQSTVSSIVSFIDEIESQVDETISAWVVLEFDLTTSDRSSGDIIGTAYDQRELYVEIGSRWYSVAWQW